MRFASRRGEAYAHCPPPPRADTYTRGTRVWVPLRRSHVRGEVRARGRWEVGGRGPGGVAPEPRPSRLPSTGPGRAAEDLPPPSLVQRKDRAGPGRAVFARPAAAPRPGVSLSRQAGRGGRLDTFRFPGRVEAASRGGGEVASPVHSRDGGKGPRWARRLPSPSRLLHLPQASEGQPALLRPPGPRAAAAASPFGPQTREVRSASPAREPLQAATRPPLPAPTLADITSVHVAHPACQLHEGPHTMHTQAGKRSRRSKLTQHIHTDTDRTRRVHTDPRATHSCTPGHTRAHRSALPVGNEEGAVIRLGVKDFGPETWTSSRDPRVLLRGQCLSPLVLTHPPEPALPRRRHEQARALGG